MLHYLPRIDKNTYEQQFYPTVPDLGIGSNVTKVQHCSPNFLILGARSKVNTIVPLQ